MENTFEKLELLVIRKTKSGPSADAKVLRLKYFNMECLTSFSNTDAVQAQGTYVTALPQLIHEDTGRIHTQFNQTVTATGRLSSSNPNLQNIPNKNSGWPADQEAFVAAPGHVLISRIN